MKIKKEKLKQNNLSSKKKNWVANQNNDRNKRFRVWNRKERRSKNFISVAKNPFSVAKTLLA